MSGSGIIISSVLQWGERIIEIGNGPAIYSSESLSGDRSVDLDPNDDRDDDWDRFFAYHRYNTNVNGRLEDTFIQSVALETSFSAFGPTAEFTRIFDPQKIREKEGTWQSLLTGFHYDENDMLRWTNLKENLYWNITSLTVTRLDGDPVDPQPAPVPLPATAPLLLAALGGTWALRRRKTA